MSTKNGDMTWQLPNPSDRPLSPIGPPLEASNLCLRCGVRVWTPDMALRDQWHLALFETMKRALDT